MEKIYDVFGTGSGCLDMNIVIDKYPERNTGTRVKDMSYQGGGKVESGVCASARLGGKVAYAGCFFDDKRGQFLLKDFKDHGINVDGSVVKHGKTFMNMVVAETEYSTRTMLGTPGDFGRITLEEMNWDYLLQSKICFVAMLDEVSRKAIEIARENDIPVLIDADHPNDALFEMIPQIDYFIGSEFVFDALFPGAKEKGLENLEEEVDSIRAKGPKTVVFTFCEHGCIVKGVEEEYYTLPAFKVDVVDTVGAVDVFHGAYAYAVTKGLSTKECARYASGTSAIKCTRIGGRAGVPTEEVLLKFLQTGEIDYTEIDKRAEYYRSAFENF